MPEHEEHCLHSEKRYGVRGDEIHSWMDEPSAIAGGSHRKFRHSLEDLPTAIQMFGKVYGEDMVENIFLDHLKADSEEERQKGISQITATEPYLDETLVAPIKVFHYKRVRNRRTHRLVKVSWGLRKGCILKVAIKISGGNNDVNINGQRVQNKINYEFHEKPSPIQISNTFSMFTDKLVEISYQVLRGMAYGRTLTETFTI
jgi:hypothetical protein